MKKIFLFFILTFSFYNCTNIKSNDVKSKPTFQNYSNEKKDSLDIRVSALASEKYDTIKRIELLKIAYQYYLDNKLKKQYQLNKYVENQSLQINDTLGVVTATMNLGYYYFSEFQDDSAYYYFSKSEKLTSKLKGKPYLENLLQCKADILWAQNNYVEAQNLAIKALRIALKKNDYDLIYSCYITIANSLIEMKKYEDAFIYYNKALEAINNFAYSPKNSSKAITYNYIAKTFQNQNQFKKSIPYLEKGLEDKMLFKLDVKVYCYLKNSLSYSKFKLGDTTVLNQLHETLKIADSIKFIPIQITSKIYLAELYLAQKDTIKANFYLKNAQISAQKNKIFDDELKILKLLGQANPKSETFYNKRYIHLVDSLQNVERDTRDKYAKIEFETEEISVQKKEVEKKNVFLTQTIWIGFGFAFLSITSLMLFFKNKSQKAKTRELILKQKQQEANEVVYQLVFNQQQKIEESKIIEKNRILKELHDNVLSSIGALQLNFYYELTKTGLDKNNAFLALSKQLKDFNATIRNFAHDLDHNIFDKNISFTEVVNELFAQIQHHSQLKFELDVSNSLDWNAVNSDIKINFYRIIQEALHNIQKYAHAKNVLISIEQIENSLELFIFDDGEGFDINSKSGGIGLKNMRSRVEALKGSIHIASNEKTGTTISVTVPI